MSFGAAKPGSRYQYCVQTIWPCTSAGSTPPWMRALKS
jgi:hypothetical protein